MTDFSQLLQLGQQMQGKITQLQTELTQRTVTGSAGGGMVTVRADGKGASYSHCWIKTFQSRGRWLPTSSRRQFPHVLDQGVPAEVHGDAEHVTVNIRVTCDDTVIGHAQSDVVCHSIIQGETG